MKCFGCQRTLEVGDHYIADTSSGFGNREAEPVVDGLLADIFGGVDGKIVLCEDCTQEGGRYKLETVYGDEEEGSPDA